MSNNINATVRPVESLKVSITSPNQPTVPSVGIGLQNITLSNMTDLDVTNLTNGSVLVYKTSNSKWVATTKLDAQDMEAGEF